VLPDDADEWVSAHVSPVGPIEVTHQRPWATVARVPTAASDVWFKACAPVQAFEPRLSAVLSRRWPDRMPGVIAVDERRAWLLLEDAGSRLGELGNSPEVWLEALPLYAELQRGECHAIDDHLAHGVPDLRTHTLPARFCELLQGDLPLDPDAAGRLRRFEPTFSDWCDDLASRGVPDSIQHDDLHHHNVFLHDGRVRFLDWGDSSMSHPFASLVVTFRFLEEINGLHPTDPWFRRLRDAYLEPWGGDQRDTLELALRVGAFAHAIAWIRQREPLDASDRAAFDVDYRVVLRRAVSVIPPNDWSGRSRSRKGSRKGRAS
jgi:hypothetical protein